MRNCLPLHGKFLPFPSRPFDSSFTIDEYYLVYHVGNSCRVEARYSSYSDAFHDVHVYESIFPHREYSIVRVSIVTDNLPLKF